MAETGFKYDVFISYSHKDEEWVVNTLLSKLENAGLKVCIDYRDFDAGKPSIVNMEDAVDESRHTVLVLTPNWTGSEWTDFEAVLTQTDDPVGRRQKLIPIMLEKCTPPKRVRSLTYVDFMRSDRLDNAWKQLFKALGKPNAPIPFPTTPKPVTGSRDTWHLAHPYPMPPNFTGRAIELKMLDDWLVDDKDRLFILRALGGFGKSALAWQWINTHVNPAEWTKLVWWSFYEGDASFDNFLIEALKYLNIKVPQGGRNQVDELLKAMQNQKNLLIMDGFERALRAYSSMNAAYQGDEQAKKEDNERACVNINAELFLKNICSLPGMKGKVLMTTRLTPRAIQPRGQFLQGCHEVELKAIYKDDAVKFFHAQGIRGTHAEIESACEPYGYHPLSLRILAGLIADDREKPGDIAVVNKLDITDDIIANKNHVLKVAYDSLKSEQQKLLSTIACFRAPMMYDALKSISSKPSGKGKKTKVVSTKELDDGLEVLEKRGLLHWDRKTNKYDLHPIVRRYAYERLTSPNRTTTHTRLMNFFEAIPTPTKVEKMEDLAPVIELYHHMARVGKYTEATALLDERLAEPSYYQFGAYQLIVELLQSLFISGENHPPPLDIEDQGWTLNLLAAVYSVSGQPRRAVPVFQNAIMLAEKMDDKENVVIGLGNMATEHLVIGALKEAEHILRRQIDLCCEIGDDFWEAVGHLGLGHLLSYRGMWQEAKENLRLAQKVLAKVGPSTNYGSVNLSYFALQDLLMARSKSQTANKYLISANQYAVRAIKWVDETTRISMTVPVDYMRAYWLLGAVYRESRNITKSDENLSKAITICRQINSVSFEADILLDLARLRYDQENYEEAKSLAEEALLITERCGYVLQGADVNLFLAQYALEQEKDKVKAKEYAETALKLAYCDGPPYYYKVAYEEAVAMLERLNV